MTGRATDAEDIPPKLAPSLHIPKSSSTVDVSIIDATCSLVCPTSCFVQPPIKGQDYLNMPTFCFLIHHKPSGKKVLFDLGTRKDWWNLSPATKELIMQKVPGLKVEKGVPEILVEGGEKLEDISSVIWSHWHYDHIGDVSLFPPSTEVIVGPGFRENFLPGYPMDQDATCLTSDFEGREVNEVAFMPSVKIGDFPVFDFFDDGSFYILDTPGHTQGHISALARTTSDTFVFMGGDICHYSGAHRPTEYLPMPAQIPASVPLDTGLPKNCPCSMFTACHRGKLSEKGVRTTPYYDIGTQPSSWYTFPDVAQKSVDALQVFDADPNVLVCIAHDFALEPVLDFFPEGTINDWKSRGWKEAAAWGFVNTLPIDGKPGRPMLVDGVYKEGKVVGGGINVVKQYTADQGLCS